MQLAFIGFGEAGQAIASGLREANGAGLRMAAWDRLFPAAVGAKLAEVARGSDVRVAKSLRDALERAELVVSVVTAGSSLEVAEEAAPLLRAGQRFLDLNSVSPGRKRRAEAAVGTGAGSYTDVAVMQPVHPKRHRVPLLLAGPEAERVAEALRGLGMDAQVAGAEVGQASVVKMVRSVMVKGWEAITAECLLAARAAGVDQTVLATFAETWPQIDWPRQAAYMLERGARHGVRRAEEMGEVARTVEELGLDPFMAAATAKRQRSLGEAGVLRNDLAAEALLASNDPGPLLDALLASLARPDATDRDAVPEKGRAAA